MVRVAFCDGWEFSRDGGAFGAVIVPHDAMLGSRRGPDAPAGSASGYFYGGSYRYRKSFEIESLSEGESIQLEFEGIYRDAVLFVNGVKVDVPPYGFIPFFADISHAVKAGENVIEVECGNADQPDCRWYSGAGIYRPVWLWRGGPCRIEPEGVRVTTLSIDPATIAVDVSCTGGKPCVRIFDEDDVLVAQGESRYVELAIPHARLWSCKQPALYRCEVSLEDGGAVVDRHEVSFGIRSLEWSADGLFINGRETLLRGGCVHCDNGILGAASWAESEERRIRILKEAGFNAIRVAHNPAPSSLLDACDKVGMYVIDEAWDVWYTRKSAHDYARRFLDWCDYDLRRMASRDYSHPSVIMYSIGNEVADPIKRQGVELEDSLVDLLHAVDPTRPVTCGFNLTMMVMERIGGGWYDDADGVAQAAPEAGPGAARASMLFNLAAQAAGTGMTLVANAPGADALVSPALDALDIAGYNYATARYGVDARKHPDRIVVGTETFAHELASNWEKVKAIPNVIGDFMWSAWDYLGEAGAGAWAYTAEEAGFSKPWPWLLAGSGALDIFGRPNAHAALAQAVWRSKGTPSIMVRPVNRMQGRTYKGTWRGSDAVPSWSWAECEKTIAQVEVYDGRAKSVRLVLNGEDVRQKPVRNCKATFQVEYQPGTLAAVALDDQGHEIARASLASARAPFHIALKPEQSHGRAGSIVYVAVDIEGANAVVESSADEQLFATLEGGVLLAFGSADPAPRDSFLTGTCASYRGRAMAVVYRDAPGVATLTVKGSRLAAQSIDIEFNENVSRRTVL